MFSWFIPTGVGNAGKYAGFFCPCSVHPHGRGERRLKQGHLSLTGGSSPRAWGTLVNQAQATAERRFIPTGVGNAKP